MRVGIIRIGEEKILNNFAKEIQKKLESDNHNVHIFDEKNQNYAGGITYFIFILDKGFLFSKKILERLKAFFKKNNQIKSNYASIYTSKNLFASKNMLLYMELLEKNGFILDKSEIIKNANDMQTISSNFEVITG